MNRRHALAYLALSQLAAVAVGQKTLARVGTQAWYEEFLSALGITHEVGPPMRYDKNGSEYVVLLSGGLNAEYNAGHHPTTLDTESNEDRASRRYEHQLLAYLGDCRHIVWRIQPQMERTRYGRYRVYSRLTAYPVTGAA